MKLSRNHHNGSIHMAIIPGPYIYYLTQYMHLNEIKS